MDKKYTFEDLIGIIDALRAPDGCPWDKEQTHVSLKKCLVNEAAETMAAIDLFEETGDGENLCEELEDMLLQVMLHSQIAMEENTFDIHDVVQVLCEKMIRRHPHVFGDEAAENSQKVLEKWEDIKKKENIGKTKEYERKKEEALTNAQKEIASYFE